MAPNTDIARKRFIFKKDPKSSFRGRLVEVDVQELDRAWRNNPIDTYISTGGKDGTIENRYSKCLEFFQKNNIIYASEVSIEYRPTKRNFIVDFSDGRHRFSVLRDSGRKRVTVLMAGWQYWYFRSLLRPCFNLWWSPRFKFLRRFWYNLRC